MPDLSDRNGNYGLIKLATEDSQAFGPLGLLQLVSVKAAKYEIQKPSTSCATLFRCKFWSTFPVFHLA